MEEDQAGQQDLRTSVLAGPDALVVLSMPCNGIQNGIFNNLAWNQGNADSPVVLQVIFLTLLADECYIC